MRNRDRVALHTSKPWPLGSPPRRWWPAEQPEPKISAAAPLVNHRSVLLASRSGYALRERERGQLIALARIADRLWELLAPTG